jgi:MtN3 and saliva related transmembrane protein
MPPVTQWIGYVGLIALTICWIPQSIETIKQGRCTVNLAFLILSALGSFSLALYAISLGDPVFTILNCLTTLGVALNIFYKLFPRRKSEEIR